MTIFVETTVKIISDAAVLNRKIAKKERTVLFRSGGYTRKVLRSRIRRSKKSSSKGQYPRAHSKGSTGLKQVLFRVSAGRLAGDFSVSIGHLRYKRKRGVPIPIGKTVPQLVNEGGRAIVPGKRGRLASVARYTARPFRALTMPDSIRNMRQNMKRVSLR